jgi:hypothetical protein
LREKTVKKDKVLSTKELPTPNRSLLFFLEHVIALRRRITSLFTTSTTHWSACAPSPLSFKKLGLWGKETPEH